MASDMEERALRSQRKLDGTSSQMEKLIFGADDTTASEYLKDLISSAGLKEAWVEMGKKFRSVQLQHAQLMSLASREALNRDFVTRVEYKAAVQEEHKDLLKDHSERLKLLEVQVQEEQQARVKLHRDVIELAAHIEQELNLMKPELNSAHSWLKRLDDRCQSQHQLVLKAQKVQEEQLNLKEEKLRQEAKAISKTLEGEIVERKVIGVEVRKQKEFLNGDAFQKHIEDTCNKALEVYVHKEEMMTEVQRSTEHMCSPLRELIANLQKGIKHLSDEFRTKDAYLEQCLENADQRFQQKDDRLNDRINAVMDELPEKATVAGLDDLKGKLLYHVDILEGLHLRLQKEATHKVQEVVTRLSEFQVILQDHEHALQHAAEEILHRGTKYDVAVLNDRLDKCALRDKTEGDMKEVREQLSWQSTKIESMQFQHGLSLQRSTSRAPSRGFRSVANLSRSSSMSEHMNMGKSLSIKQALVLPADGGTAKKTEGQAEDSSADRPGAVQRSGTGNSERVETGMTISLMEEENADSNASNEADPLRRLLDMNAGPEIHEHLLDQQDQLQMLQDQLAELQQGSFMSGGSTLTEVIQQQLECLSQAVFCLGRLCLSRKSDGIARQQQSSELIGHLRSVMHWIIHRQRPAEWDPGALTTMSLGAQLARDDLLSPALPVLPRETKEKPVASLRRAKAAPKEEESLSTGRQFAMGGTGWQQRSIPASGYDDPKRPQTSGAVLGRGFTETKRALVATPGVADMVSPEEDMLSLPPLQGEPMSARSSLRGKS